MRIDAPTPARILAALRGGHLAGACELRLGGLGLTEVPTELFGVADTLRLLDLGGNRLTSLPAGFARLRRLEVLFLSGNPLDLMPPVVGDCPALSQIGARGCRMREYPAEALPPRLRWLTLTDNELDSVPRELGGRPLLRKLMLAGNRLSGLPDSLRDAPDLELIRLAANRLETLPTWLTTMPRLAWLAWSGNPLDTTSGGTEEWGIFHAIPWADLSLRELLGQGASGRVHAADWRHAGHDRGPVAVKLFKGVMTSDGLPSREMAACLAAGPHPHLAGGIGRVADHPEGVEGLVMPLLPKRWRPLADPPSLASCSRDVYDPALRLSVETATRIGAGIAHACAHLHARGLLHGDLYAHNVLWDGEAGNAVLSDFGAASFMPRDAAAPALERLDVLAFGLLLGELIERCDGADEIMCSVHEACVAPEPASRPRMADVADALTA